MVKMEKSGTREQKNHRTKEQGKSRTKEQKHKE
jgi:hypothetical protein